MFFLKKNFLNISLAHCDASPGRDTEAVCDEFDEFGFKVDIEDGPEQSSSKLLSTPFQDNPQQRLKWLAHLEFAQTSSSPLPKVRVNSNII